MSNSNAPENTTSKSHRNNNSCNNDGKDLATKKWIDDSANVTAIAAAASTATSDNCGKSNGNKPEQVAANYGLSALKLEAEISEAELILRPCEVSRRNSLSVPSQRRPQSSQQNSSWKQLNGGQPEGESSVSDTSDVNSDDDAASIVSRLSQIVIEQEEQLASPSGSMVEKTTKSDRLADCRSGDARMKHAKSTGNLNAPHVDKVWQLGGNQVAKNVPSINIMQEFGNDTKEPMVKERSKSVYVNIHSQAKESDENDDLPTRVMRRNDSSGFLPERGNLRELESSRNQKEQQHQVVGPTNRVARSNTISGVDTPLLFDDRGQLLLNIRRSAWTLSQFEKDFGDNQQQIQQPREQIGPTSYSNSDRSSSPASCESLNSMHLSSKTPSPEPLKLTATNNNLLIRASKNVLQLSGQGNNLRLSPPVNTMDQPNNKRRCSADFSKLRRPSHCHSITSLASSLKSSGRGGRGTLSSVLGRGKPRKHRDFDNQQQNFDDSDSTSGDRCCRWNCFTRYVPILDWLPRYKMNLFWGDLTAGLVVAVLNISTSLSAAVVAETELSTAFRSSIISTFIFACFSSSKHTSFGSWSIMSQLLVIGVRQALSDELILNRINLGPAASWEPEEYERWHLNIIIMYTFLIGLIQLLCGFLNLGNLLASFIPEALCSSMIAATAFTMAIGQLANMCGTSNKILWAIERNTTELWADLKNPPVDITDIFSDLFRWVKQIALLIKYYEQINMICVALSVGSVILLYLNQYVLKAQLQKLFKRNIFFPFEMVLLILAITISYWLNLEEEYKTTTSGPIHIEFIMPNLPDLRLLRELWSDSVATALISYTMVYIMSKTYANKFNYEIDCNQELLACGAGNLIGGMFDALPATASFSRTAGQVEAGGNTQMASIINCVILVILAQLFGRYVAFLPVCVMSATLFFGFVRMMGRTSEAVHYWRICKVDFAIWVVTFVAILTTDMVNGFICGFIFSILTMLYRAQNRRCYLLGTIGTSDVYVPLARYPIAQEIDGIKIFQFCGPIHYVCAELFERLLRHKTRVNVKLIMQSLEETEMERFQPQRMNLPTHIILDFSMISYVDSAGIHIIKKIIEDHRKVNISIFIASLASHVAAVVKSEPSLWGVYKERFYVTLADAVHCAILDRQKMDLVSDIQAKL